MQPISFTEYITSTTLLASISLISKHKTTYSLFLMSLETQTPSICTCFLPTFSLPLYYRTAQKELFSHQLQV